MEVLKDALHHVSMFVIIGITPGNYFAFIIVISRLDFHAIFIINVFLTSYLI